MSVIKNKNQEQCLSQENSFENMVFQSVAYVTHKCPILQTLFLRWTEFNEREKVMLNYLVFHIISKDMLLLYIPIIKGFYYWESVQDTEGACGYHENPLTFKLSNGDEQRICNVILATNSITIQYELRLKLNKEICSFNCANLKKVTPKFGSGDSKI